MAALSERYRANAEAIDGELKERLHLMGITQRSRPDAWPSGKAIQASSADHRQTAQNFNKPFRVSPY
jgi:hypothetical protein